MKIWWIVLLLLISPSLGAGENVLAGTNEDAKQRAEERRQQQLPPDQPIDFISLRKKADDLAGRQQADLKLHQAEVEFSSSTLRINQVNFHYFRPTPSSVANSKWERLQVHVSTGGRVTTGRTARGSYPGTIGASSQAFGDPPPTAAPINFLAPEDVIRRLNRGPLSSTFGDPRAGPGPAYLKNPSRWKLNVQLIRVGSQYMAGTVTLSPIAGGHVHWIKRAIQPSLHDPFFKHTAPAGKWLWWTVAQQTNMPGERYEYIYMDAITGKFTSHCAEPSGPRNAVVPVPVPCGPPSKGR
jgi:hypothetical protein